MLPHCIAYNHLPEQVESSKWVKLCLYLAILSERGIDAGRKSHAHKRTTASMSMQRGEVHLNVHVEVSNEIVNDSALLCILHVSTT